MTPKTEEKMTPAPLDAALVKRVLRAAIMAFVSTYGASNLLGVAQGSQQFDSSLARAAVVAGGVVIVSAIWNIFLDPSPIPSLAPPEEPGV